MSWSDSKEARDVLFYDIDRRRRITRKQLPKRLRRPIARFDRNQRRAAIKEDWLAPCIQLGNVFFGIRFHEGDE